MGVVSSNKGSKSEMIENAIDHFIGDFSYSDIKRACPNVSRPTIHRVLEKLKKENKIQLIEKGRDAKWKKVH